MAFQSRSAGAGDGSAVKLGLLIAVPLVAILVVVLITSSSGRPSRPVTNLDPPHASRRAPSSSPLRGWRLYADPSNAAARQVAAWRASGDTADAAALVSLATRPMGHWLTGTNPSPAQVVPALMSRAAAANSVAVLVLYDIPRRDCGGYSSGGATTGAEYIAWIRSIAAGIARQRVIVILEPDAIDQAAEGCYSAAFAAARYGLLNRAIALLKADPAARVYLDAGHPQWLSPERIADPLRRAGVRRADGFALNVANFQTTAASIAYGRRLGLMIGRRNFVIDTSRNGNGPPSAGSGNAAWCNPPGMRLGTPPTTVTGHQFVDAFLWVKNPGTSDGDCRPGEPAAGTWWPAEALALVRGP